MIDDRQTIATRVLTAVVVSLVPVIALSLSPWQAATGLLALGLLPTLTATPSGRKAMLASMTVSTVVAFAAVLTTGTGALLPWVGTTLVVLLAFVTGALSPHGLHPVGAGTISFTVYLLVDPSLVLATLSADEPTIGAAALVAGAVLMACLWVIGMTHLLLRGVRLPTVTGPTTLPYGLLLAALCGAFTLVCLLWFRGTNAWWTVMTIAVILQPSHADTHTKTNGRIAGTVLGGTAAALLVSMIPTGSLATLVGVAATLGAVILLLADAPYWMYSSAVTMSVVLLTFDAQTVVAGDLQRIAFTAIAAAVTAATVWAASRFAPRRPGAADTAVGAEGLEPPAASL